jgi:ubiquinone/menaquinone biosynthesis C-methylase UbiE/Flp pilus assembly protein TadD
MKNSRRSGGPAQAPSPLDGILAEAIRHHQAGRLAQAERDYRDVLAINPRHAGALHWLGVAASQRGDQTEALRCLRQALALRPDSGATATNIAQALLLAGRAEESANAATQALAITETPQAKALFAQALALSRNAEQLDPSRAMMTRAIVERWTRPADIARIASQAIMASAARHAETTRADPLLLALLTAAPVATTELERHLTQMRRTLLARAGAGDRVDIRTLKLFAALARQCFINEYVFAQGADEIADVQALHAKRAAGETLSPLQLIAVAAYVPLHTIEGAERLLSQTWPEPIAPLLVQQIAEPLAERALRHAIPHLTAISGDVSRAVQNQYEDNPYPRWNDTAAAVSTQDKPLKALVAGCGTGRQSVELAQRHPAARILAIDLSLASLSYALRKTRELGLTNITHAQADIMALGSIGRTFDLIEANGVLHHLADPWAGWRVLLSLLRPDGEMRIGLYSERARQPVITAHAFIAEQGYGRTADDIRRFRQDVLAEETPAMLPQSRDFYTVSGCRDLLFHVQEHRMTLPQIKAFIAANGLMFQGFDLDAVTLQAYRTRYPADQAGTDLDSWHAFEEVFPNTFVRMYQFRVRKA